jgi:uncharacterized membrane protein YfcA
VIVGLALLVGGMAAGVFGSLLGLGGGILIVPLLTLGFGLPLRDAVGVSLVCVIVTSGASAAVYLERRTANLRLGMLLELFTAIGAVVGGAIAFLLDERLLAGLFTALLLYVAISMARRREPEPEPDPHASPVPDRATPAFVSRLAGPEYRVHRIGPGLGGSVLAGVLSALLGIGGGLGKVPVMHLVMGIPLRVATATSNLMIGITASTSAIVYLLRGGIDPFVAGPTAVGVFLGATLGSMTAHRLNLRLLRALFVVVLLYTAVLMARRALGLG